MRTPERLVFRSQTLIQKALITKVTNRVRVCLHETNEREPGRTSLCYFSKFFQKSTMFTAARLAAHCALVGQMAPFSATMKDFLSY